MTWSAHAHTGRVAHQWEASLSSRLDEFRVRAVAYHWEQLSFKSFLPSSISVTEAWENMPKNKGKRLKDEAHDVDLIVFAQFEPAVRALEVKTWHRQANVS